MTPAQQSLLAVGIASAIPIAGTLLFAAGARRFMSLAPHLIPFAVGAMVGAAAFHLLPEAVATAAPLRVLAVFAGGLVAFRLIDRLAHGRRAPSAAPAMAARTAAPAALLSVSIASDALHNLVDGILIATTFLAEPALGVITAAAVALHEIPRELGTFALCVSGGLSVRSALLVNVMTAGLALFGALAVIAIGGAASRLGADLVPFTAGGFLYLAVSIVWIDRLRLTSRTEWVRYLALALVGVAATGLARH